MSSKVDNQYQSEGLGKGILVLTVIASCLLVLALINPDFRIPKLPVDRVHLVAASIGIIALSLAYLALGVFRRGRVLVDCGPNPQRFLHLGQSLLFLVIWGLGPENVAAAGGSGLTFLMAFGRIKLTNRGIWRGCCLLKWSKVSSWQWVEEDRLLITTTRSSQFTLTVRPDQRDAADNVLKRFCGGPLHRA